MSQTGLYRAAVGACVIVVVAVAMLGCPNGVGVTCPTGQEYCNGMCTFVLTDARNCGACGASCPPGLGCFAGGCGCPAGLATCNETCVNTSADNHNCGACGQDCPAGQICSDGTCSLTCPGALSNCGGTCADTQVDSRNCGTCGNACAADNFCVDGKCTLGCPAPLLKCLPDGGASPDGTLCVDPRVDPNNCGGCSIVCGVAEGRGQLSCCGACVDLNTDFDNCGFCGRKCNQGDFCSFGTCQPG